MPVAVLAERQNKNETGANIFPPCAECADAVSLRLRPPLAQLCATGGTPTRPTERRGLVDD
jgi:hypothetical protein